MMFAIAEGEKPKRGKKGPSKAVAKEFVAADKKAGPRKLPETRAKPKAEY
jgi:hypothetical protein